MSFKVKRVLSVVLIVLLIITTGGRDFTAFASGSRRQDIHITDSIDQKNSTSGQSLDGEASRKKDTLSMQKKDIGAAEDKGKDVGQESKTEAGKDAGQESKTEAGKDAGQESKTEAGKETDKEIGKDTVQKPDKNKGQESDTGAGQEKDTAKTEENQAKDKKDPSDQFKNEQDQKEKEAESSSKEASGKKGINLKDMKSGETITFKAMQGSATKKVSVTQGTHYDYSDYGLGSYETYKYHVKFGNVSATAYCIEPSKHSPGSGTYTITKLADGKKLAKVCFYGTKAAGEDSFFSGQHSGFSEGKKFILVHLAASYANSGSDAFSGANSTARKLALELYNWCMSQPDIPDVDMAFSDNNVTAYVEGKLQRTKEIVFKADKLQTVTFHLPAGVKLHNLTTGKTSKAGADVEVSGGTRFYLSAPLSQAGDVKEFWKTTMKGSIVKDFSAYKISIGDGEQDLALVFGEGVDDEKYVDFKVTWLSLGELTIYKEGQDFVSVTRNSDGVVFNYENKRQQNAVYNLYADENIKDGSGKIIYNSGALVAGNLTTDASGSVTVKNLYAGLYRVTEQTAPQGFYNSKQSKQIRVNYTGGSAGNSNSLTFVNERQKADVSAVKKDKDTINPLKGGIFGLYAGNDIKNSAGSLVLRKDELIAKAVTGSDGKAQFPADIPLGNSYYIKEIKAPENYYRNQKDTYFFRFAYAGENTERQSFTHIFFNDRTNARIHLIKKDKETGSKPQGDAVLSGAVYGLYAREDIVHPDGRTGVLYRAGSRVAVLTTDETGQAEVKDLYLGKYFFKEISPSTGYLIDDEEHNVTASYEGDLKLTVERETISEETVKKQPFQIIKAANNEQTDAELLKGAGFKAYLISSLSKDSAGNYDYGSADPVVLTDTGGREMITDEKGHAVSIPIPYGTYIVVESTTPHNYNPVKPFVVTIRENHPDTPQVWRVLLDEEFKAKLKIIKQDDETKRSILLPETEFKIYDIGHKEYVKQTTTYPKPVVHSSFFTDEEGCLVLPQNLKIGSYRIEEIKAPEGYYRNKDYPVVQVDSDTMHRIDPVSGDAIIEVIYEDHPVKGELTISKSGECPVSFDGKKFIYKVRGLEGAEYEIYAAEDIYTPDHQRDINGDRLLVLVKDSLVKTITTDKTGKAVADNLPLGAYYVKEKTAPYGFVINLTEQDSIFEYAGQDIPVITHDMEFTNQRQKVDLSVLKKDERTKHTLSDAEFALYSKEPIISCGQEIVPADTLLGIFISDDKGKAACSLDLPMGKYYVRETKAPAGYYPSDKRLDFDASWQGQEIETIKLESDFYDNPISIAFSKSDLTTGTELSGARLSVFDHQGQLVETWVSEKDQPHMIYGLSIGETYTLREELAPYGYLRASEVIFTVPEEEEIQKVEMKDEVPRGTIIINKKGEFLSKVSLIDHIKGIAEHLFSYITGKLNAVTFDIFAAEDIKAADGSSEDYYHKDEMVGSITTDHTGTASMEGLPLGRYYVKEKNTVHGHVLEKEPQMIDLTYRDQDTPVVVYNKEWQNARQKISVGLVKVEKGTEKGLPGGIFGLFTGKVILSSEGNQLMEADEIIELKTTDENGRIDFTADLPVDGDYYIKELYAPPGYVKTEEKQSFSTPWQGENTVLQTVALTFEDELTTTAITKSDLTTGKELPGARLKVTDKDGKTADSWVSGHKPHIIKGLTAGQTYTLTETKPADGYATAESIHFTVDDTSKTQKIDMKDDVTKLYISKQDIAGKELPGARLSIYNSKGEKVAAWTSTGKPHYITMLPIGRYTLREETAPKGYKKAEEITFEVKDTGKVQHVKMVDRPNHTRKSSKGSKTGDDTPVNALLLLLAAGLTGTAALLYYLLYYRKKQKYKP